MNLVKYTDQTSETTPYTAGSLAPYAADGEPPMEWCISKSDAIWEAQERLRVGNCEAAGEWLLVAEALG